MKRKYYIFSAILIILAVLGGAYYFQFEYLGNFHAISDGVAYRSGQLSYERLQEVTEEFGIRSVLNLRGKSPGRDWYDEEIKACEELGISHYDVGIRARFEPPPDKIRAIIDVFKDAPRPILIHCRAGADRAGLVSAMWKMVVEGQNKEEAGQQLSWRYGHLPFGQAAPMDDFFERWDINQ